MSLTAALALHDNSAPSMAQHTIVHSSTCVLRPENTASFGAKVTRHTTASMSRGTVTAPRATSNTATGPPRADVFTAKPCRCGSQSLTTAASSQSSATCTAGTSTATCSSSAATRARCHCMVRICSFLIDKPRKMVGRRVCVPPLYSRLAHTLTEAGHPRHGRVAFLVCCMNVPAHTPVPAPSLRAELSSW